MSRFIKSLFIFIPFAIIAYIVLICAWGDFAPGSFKQNLSYRIGSYGHLFTRVREIDTIKSRDIVFLGSSHAYRGFDVRIFQEHGFSSFNLGSSAQTPLQTEVLLNRYLKKLNPKIIVYEVGIHPSTFSSDGVESGLDIVANDRNDFESVKMVLKQKHIKVLNTLIYGFYADLFNKNKAFVEPKHRKGDIYILGGFVEKEVKHFKHMAHEKKTWDSSSDQFTAFEKNLEIFKKNNIRVILVQAPITRSLYQSYSNPEEFDKIMNAYGEYYNFNKILTLDDSLHFYDPHHLNQRGVEIFNKAFIEKVLEKPVVQK